MTDSDPRKTNTSTKDGPRTVLMQDIQKDSDNRGAGVSSGASSIVDDTAVLDFLQAFSSELDSALTTSVANP